MLLCPAPPPSRVPSLRYLPLLALLGCGTSAPRSGLDFPEPSLWLMGNLDASELLVREQIGSLEDWWLPLTPDGPPRDRAFSPGPLTQDLSGSAPPPPASAPRIGLFHLDPSALDRHRRALATPGCTDPSIAERSFTEGDCLIDGACRRARTTETTVDGWERSTTWREVDLLDRREALIGRWQANEAPQHLGVDVWVVDPDDARRTYRLSVIWWADDSAPSDPAEALDARLAQAAERVQGGCDDPL